MGLAFNYVGWNMTTPITACQGSVYFYFSSFIFPQKVRPLPIIALILHVPFIHCSWDIFNVFAVL